MGRHAKCAGAVCGEHRRSLGLGKPRICWLLVLVVVAVHASKGFAQREYGFVNTQPSGQSYLPAEKTVRRMRLAPGWRVELAAAEPLVVNPIAFTVDEKGRVWVVECFEYPKRTPPGKQPRDRIVVLEDTDGDGCFDKRTVWAEGKDFPVPAERRARNLGAFDLASGIEVGYGGVFLGAPPYLWFLRDTDGDGRADRFDILLRGFGSQDTHETLNTFTWGPDGWLYGLHGVFTQSEVTDPSGARRPVVLNAAVWRYHPTARTFEVFAEGTSNPWGLDFDQEGNCFICCCVIPHLFHMVPGGIYKRQAGASLNPYAFGYMPEICDHTHHRESGWAHAGLLLLQGRHVPAEWQNSVLMGSIHGSSIKRDVLRRQGATFVASHAPDLLQSGDRNVRPIQMRWAPDGSILLSDWHDQNPCHQAHPDSWDYERGRLYRLRGPISAPRSSGDLSQKPLDELVRTAMYEDIPWRWRTALRLVQEKTTSLPEDERRQLLEKIHSASVPDSAAAMRKLWVQEAMGIVTEPHSHSLAAARAWAARTLAERRPHAGTLAYLTRMAREEKDSRVRLQLASCALRLVNVGDTLPLVQALLDHPEDADDPFVPLMVWYAWEPVLAQRPAVCLEWLRTRQANRLVLEHVVERSFRRLAAEGRPEAVTLCLTWLDGQIEPAAQQRALLGLIQGLEGKKVQPVPGWAEIVQRLQKSPDSRTSALAHRVALLMRDPKALAQAKEAILDTRLPASSRIEAMQTLALLAPEDSVQALLRVLDSDPDLGVRIAAARHLSASADASLAARVLARWSSYPAQVRQELVLTLRSRKPWARALLHAVGQGQVARTELSDNTILVIRGWNDAELDALVEKVWGRYRATPRELEHLVAKMRAFVSEAPGDPVRGRKVFEKQCQQCHRFDGQGHSVGPDLDGAERSLDYLVINILDPNRVIGQPYYQRFVTLQSGRVVVGIVAAEDARSLTLKREGGQIEVIAKDDIEQMQIVEKSLMPEGLANQMTPEEFRDLVWYLVRREAK
ncbi:MAG: hypothetical protein C4297_09090 [Gemmataceae bacterium]